VFAAIYLSVAAVLNEELPLYIGIQLESFTFLSDLPVGDCPWMLAFLP
jgi:hypothetical protein